MTRLLALPVFALAAAVTPAADPPPGPGVRPTNEKGAGAPGALLNPTRGDGAGAFAFAADGKWLVGSGPNGKLARYEPWGDAVGPGFGPDGGRGYGQQFGLAAHPARPWVVVAVSQQYDRTGTRVTVWDYAAGKQLRDLEEGASSAWLSNPAFDPAGKTVWLWEWYYRGQPGVPRNPGQTTVLRVWDAETGDEVRAVTAPEEVPAYPDGGIEAHRLAFAPSGAWAAVVSGRRVCLLEVATGKVRADLGLLPGRAFPPDPYTPRPRTAGVADAVAVAGDGRQVLVGCPDGAVRRWDVLTGRELPPLVGHKEAVRAVWCSADGKTAKSLSADKLLTWEVPPAGAGWTPPAAPPAGAALAALVDQLAADDPAARYAAVETLAAHPAAAVAALADRVRPVPAVDRERLAGLVKDVYGADYNARKRAMREVRAIGEPALAALTDPAENRGRMYSEGPAGRLIQELRQKADPAAAARGARAVELLERVGGPDASRLLDELAAGAAGVPLTRAAAEAAGRVKGRAAAPAAAADPAGLWADLGSADAAKGFAAMRGLAARPAEAVPLLRTNLLASPARTGPDLGRVPELVAALGSDDFAEREAATKELAGLGRAAVPALRAAAPAANPEARRRLDGLLRAPPDPAARPAALQAARAVEVLEWVGGADARAALAAAADGATDEAFREAASAAAGRLGR